MLIETNQGLVKTPILSVCLTYIPVFFFMVRPKVPKSLLHRTTKYPGQHPGLEKTTFRSAFALRPARDVSSFVKPRSCRRRRCRSVGVSSLIAVIFTRIAALKPTSVHATYLKLSVSTHELTYMLTWSLAYLFTYSGTCALD